MTKLELPPLATVDRERTHVESLSQLAYLLIRDKIITVELPPGALIEEKALSEEFELGRTPIREALALLASEHFVTAIPRRGRVVSDINLGDLRRIYEVRAICEGSAARLAVARANAEEKRAAHGYLEQLATFDPTDFDERAFVQLDHRCHVHYYKCTHNAFFAETLERYLNLSLRLWYYHMDSLVEDNARTSEHEGMHELDALLHALIEGDGDTAEQVTQRHIARSQQVILTPLLPRAEHVAG